MATIGMARDVHIVSARVRCCDGLFAAFNHALVLLAARSVVAGTVVGGGHRWVVVVYIGRMTVPPVTQRHAWRASDVIGRASEWHYGVSACVLPSLQREAVAPRAAADSEWCARSRRVA